MEGIEVISRQNDILGEGPMWDKKYNRLYWVDIIGRSLKYYDVSGGQIITKRMSGPISSVAQSKSGKLYITMGHGFYSIDSFSNNVKLLYEIEVDVKDNRFNDGKVDPYGNYWAGTMDINQKDATGSLYVFHRNGKIIRILEDLTVSNGLSWNLKEMKFYHIDSPTRKIRVFDYIRDGGISNGKVSIDFRDQKGVPDGMTIDDEGMLWIAHWGGSRISRWDPTQGKKIDEIQLPALNITSCTFGGKDLDELYVTSRTLTEAQKREDKDIGGSLFCIRTGVRGVETQCFDDGLYCD